MKKAGIKKKWFMGLLALGLLLTFMASGSANGLDIAVFCKWNEDDPNGASVLLYIESIQEGEGGFFEEIVGTADAVFRESTASCMEDGDDIYDVVNPSFNSDWQDLTFSGGTLTKTALRTGHSLTHMPYQAPATCVDWGHVECYFCSQCEGSFSEDDKWSNEPIENPDIDPLDPDDVTRHLWGDQPEWNWNYDHTSVEVTFSCNRDPENEHTYTMTVTNISDDGTTADCTGPKEKTYTAIAELCGKQYTGTDAVAVEPVDHEYEEFLETVTPTCQAGGYDVYQCKWCTETTHKNETQAVDHDYTELVETVVPTCQAGGYDVYQCKWCTETTHKNETQAVDHDYTELLETIAATTCQEGGYDVYQCKWCTETTHKNPTAPLAHVYDVFMETAAPTCQAGGYDIYKCKWCNATTHKNETAAVDHDYTELVETVAPTCQAGGYDIYRCEWCEETTRKNDTAPLDHDYTELVETVAPTCQAGGYDIYR